MVVPGDVVTVRCQGCADRRLGEIAPALALVERSLAYASHSDACGEAFEETAVCSCGAQPRWALRPLRRRSALAGLRSGKFRSPEYAAALGVIPAGRRYRGEVDPTDVPSRVEALRTKQVSATPWVRDRGWMLLPQCRRCRRAGPRLNLAKLYAHAERALLAGADLYR